MLHWIDYSRWLLGVLQNAVTSCPFANAFHVKWRPVFPVAPNTKIFILFFNWWSSLIDENYKIELKCELYMYCIIIERLLNFTWRERKNKNAFENVPKSCESKESNSIFWIWDNLQKQKCFFTWLLISCPIHRASQSQYSSKAVFWAPKSVFEKYFQIISYVQIWLLVTFWMP